VKELVHPVTGQHVKFGRNRPSLEMLARPRLLLGDYMIAEALPPMPATTGARYQQVLDVVGRMYGNDKFGCCTKAGQAHLIGFFTGTANPPAATFTDQQVIDDYLRLTGGQDTGLDEITVLEDWRDNKALPLGVQHSIAGFAAVDATAKLHVQFALDAFPNLYLGLALPDAYVSPFPSGNGFTWDVAGDPDQENGHAIVASDYTEDGIIVWTWGMWGTMTWAALAKYLVPLVGGELHVVMTQEAINKASQKTTSGFDWVGLQADLPQIGQLAA
jgi:hypothetical protein